MDILDFCAEIIHNSNGHEHLQGETRMENTAKKLENQRKISGMVSRWQERCMAQGRKTSVMVGMK